MTKDHLFILLMVLIAETHGNDPLTLRINELKFENILPFLELKSHIVQSGQKDLTGYGIIVVEFTKRALIAK